MKTTKCHECQGTGVTGWQFPCPCQIPAPLDPDPALDAKDNAIRAERAAAFLLHDKPEQGDYLIFADGTARRIAHVWDEGVTEEYKGAQTCDYGSFYLGNDYMSHSGSLYRSTPLSRISPTDETRPGTCWFFSHNIRRAHNGVQTRVPCRVWRTTETTEGVRS